MASSHEIDFHFTRFEDFDRRRHRRVARPGMRVSLDGSPGDLQDLSVDGARVSIASEPTPGDVVDMTLTIEGHPPIRIMALVRWVREPADGRSMIGLHFVWLPRHMADTLRAELSDRLAA